MSQFQEWLAEADMPMQDEDGNWHDAETGIGYNPNIDYFNTEKPRRTRATVSTETKANRAEAAKWGGKALTGSPKQKTWGEAIRAEKVREMALFTPFAQIEALLQSETASRAAFWIENRDLSGAEIAAAGAVKREPHPAAVRWIESCNLSIQKFEAVLADADTVAQEKINAFLKAIKAARAKLESAETQAACKAAEKAFKAASKLQNEIPQEYLRAK